MSINYSMFMKRKNDKLKIYMEIGDEARKRLGIYDLPTAPFKWWCALQARIYFDAGEPKEVAIESVIYEYHRRNITGIQKSISVSELESILG